MSITDDMAEMMEAVAGTLGQSVCLRLRTSKAINTTTGSTVDSWQTELGPFQANITPRKVYGPTGSASDRVNVEYVFAVADLVNGGAALEVKIGDQAGQKVGAAVVWRTIKAVEYQCAGAALKVVVGDAPR